MPETFWSTTEVVGESIDQSQQDISSSSSIQKDPAMVRRDSEWVFEKFLRETTNGSSSPAILEGGGEEEESDVVEMMMDDCNVRKKSRRIVVEGDSHSLPGKSCVPDPEFLKKQLDLACAAAAVAFCRKNVQELSPPLPSAEVVTITGSEMASQAPVNGSAFGVQKMLKNDIHGNVGSSRSALSKAQNSVGQPQTKPLTSSSSREQTDEDELLSGVETVENLDPADAKRVKRMISNRESARRSRRRKQAHLSELETQVSQLKGENSSLIEKLSDLSKKYHGACVNSRILKADVETMRAKVKMAEDMVKRVTGVAVGASPRWVGGITKLWNNAMNESVEVSKKCVEVESPPLNGIDASNWNNIKCSISK